MDIKDYIKNLRFVVLGDCKGDFVFVTCRGIHIHNIYELVNELKAMDNNNFSYHVNEVRNDFAQWILDILGDGELARRLLKIKNRKYYAKIIKGRIEELDEC